jgi:two-component system sensor histidine kinase BaeS
VSALARLGLRARLAIALVGVAVLAVGLATLLANRGLHPLVNDAARSRLQRSAQHFSELAATVYQDEGGWSANAKGSLTHLAKLDGLRFAVLVNGSVRFGRVDPGSDTASAPVRVAGRTVGIVEIAGDSSGLLTPEESQLQRSLDRLHLAAGAISVAAALLLAFLLAQTLARPLRRIRAAAEQIEEGDLQARVDPTGDPELRSVAHALNRLAETLEYEEEVRKHTVADLAHELRTPVHGLLSRIEAAQDDVLEDGYANLAAMHAEAVRLTRLLDELSRLADAERPGLLLDKMPVDLAALAGGAVRSFTPRFAEAGVAFTTAIQPALTRGDAGRLDQIVANLLENALRYTERGGTVVLRVHAAEAGAVLEVEDTGIGIPAGDLRHIFTRFWRGEKSRSRSTGGAGIGLAIVRELVRAHDGTIEVESTVGEGTRFRVRLPAGPGEARRPRPDQEYPARV